MEFCLLGPLAVRRGDTVVPIQAGKQRAVLAALLLKANRVVLVEELAEALWGTAPPPSARVTLQNYVVRLRKALGDAFLSQFFQSDNDQFTSNGKQYGLGWNAQSFGPAGTATFPIARVTFERTLPPIPFSITRNAMIGLPLTITIFE